MNHFRYGVQHLVGPPLLLLPLLGRHKHRGPLLVPVLFLLLLILAPLRRLLLLLGRCAEKVLSALQLDYGVSDLGFRVQVLGKYFPLSDWIMT
jgi:hypothetical protein